MSQYQLCLAYFVHQHKCLWDSSDPNRYNKEATDAAWAQILEDMEGPGRPWKDSCAMKEEYIQMKDEYLYGNREGMNPVLRKFLKFLEAEDPTFEPELRITDFDVRDLGREVGFPNDVFDEDKDKAVKGIAKMIRAQRDRRYNCPSDATLNIDQDGTRKWNALVKAQNRKDRNEAVRPKKDRSAESEAGFRRPHLNREKEIRNRGGRHGSFTSRDHPTNRFGGRFDDYAERRASGFGASAEYRPFGSGSSQFGDERPHRREYGASRFDTGHGRGFTIVNSRFDRDPTHRRFGSGSAAGFYGEPEDRCFPRRNRFDRFDRDYALGTERGFDRFKRGADAPEKKKERANRFDREERNRFEPNYGFGGGFGAGYGSRSNDFSGGFGGSRLESNPGFGDTGNCGFGDSTCGENCFVQPSSFNRGFGGSDFNHGFGGSGFGFGGFGIPADFNRTNLDRPSEGFTIHPSSYGKFGDEEEADESVDAMHFFDCDDWSDMEQKEEKQHKKDVQRLKKAIAKSDAKMTDETIQREIDDISKELSLNTANVEKLAKLCKDTLRDDPMNYQEFYEGDASEFRDFMAANRQKYTKLPKKKTEKRELKPRREGYVPKMFPTRFGRIDYDDFDSASDGEEHFPKPLEFSDEEFNQKPTKPVAAKKDNAMASEDKKKKPAKPVRQPMYLTHTKYGSFNVETEELADAITWLNDPANEGTIKRAVKAMDSGRMCDIDRLINKKMEIQEKYSDFWRTEIYEKKSERPTGALADFLRMELGFSDLKPAAKKLTDIQEQFEEFKKGNRARFLLPPAEHVATTTFGPIKTKTEEEASAITYLNDPKNMEVIKTFHEYTKPIEKKDRNTIGRYLAVEKEFIDQWKLVNLGKPLKKIPLSEMKYILSKENQQQLEADEELAKVSQREFDNFLEDDSTFYDDHPFVVSTRHGMLTVTDRATAFALKWLRDHSIEVKKAREGSLTGQIGDFLKKLLNLEKAFLDNFRKEHNGKPVKSVDAVMLAFVKEKVEERRAALKKLKEDKAVSGAPANNEERAIYTQILEMEQHKRRNWAGIYAHVDGKDLNIKHGDSASAINWLNKSDNKKTVEETKKKIAEGKKLNDIELLIQKKIQLEKEFVDNFNSEGRTDFELSFISPNELNFVKTKKQQYLDENNEKKSEATLQIEFRNEPNQTRSVRTFDRDSVAELTKRMTALNKPFVPVIPPNAIVKKISDNVMKVTVPIEQPKPIANEINKVETTETIGQPAAPTIETSANAENENIVVNTEAQTEGAKSPNSTISAATFDIANAAQETEIANAAADLVTQVHDLIEQGVEPIAGEAVDDDFEYKSPLTSSFEHLEAESQTGQRTSELSGVIADALAELELSDPEKFKAKKEALMKLLLE